MTSAAPGIGSVPFDLLQLSTLASDAAAAISLLQKGRMIDACALAALADTLPRILASNEFQDIEPGRIDPAKLMAIDTAVSNVGFDPHSQKSYNELGEFLMGIQGQLKALARGEHLGSAETATLQNFCEALAGSFLDQVELPSPPGDAYRV